ncbi:UDP-N-acetylmuramoyl-tripeptide--D-alanyl-D-alanine ligase [candidate division KSB1 bacterium]|nr:UDP-N-acetylmuramoyl-tripeptide--D-alanyl-D-alanine ligase [candidate division KSB1 bacterium]RQW03695.1 MAG: UDP-N-acetylmuramoyl-tripeptide--D-alanyl-D-alanine ligase [candidate division KSB1 bacterium]
MNFALAEIAAAFPCRIIGALSQDALAGVSTDTRRVQPGELFVALRGDVYDGHEFVLAALAKGAVALLVDHHYVEQQEQLPRGTFIIVDDTLKAYQQLARFYRNKLSPTVVALTGSAGKTTCKEFIHAVLSEKYSVHRNARSFNNHVGVPATLLELTPQHQILVTELGTSHFGEIANLSFLVQPDVCLLLNIGYAHLEFLNDLDGVARAKMEIFAHAAADNIAIYNADDALLSRQIFPSAEKMTFAIKAPADVRAGDIRCDERACYAFTVRNAPFQLAIPGRHNVYNALAAIAVGLQFKVPLARMAAAIARVTAVEHRMTVLHRRDVTIIDDAYNANPGSCAVALETLADFQIGAGGRRIAVIGDMLELGDCSQREHEKLAAVAQQNNVDALFLYGDASAATAERAKQLPFLYVGHFKGQSDLAAELAGFLSRGDVVLVKGSRAMHMENVVHALMDGEK